MSTHKYFHDNRNDQILIYVNGEILPRDKAKISVFDSGFLLGDGVWEGIRFHNGHLVFIQEHLDRLFHGASSLDIDIGVSEDRIKSLIISVLDANTMVTDIHIRLIVSRGLKKTPYQHPNANIGGSTIVIIPEYKKADKTINKKGISLATVSARRGTADTQDPRLNTLSKLNCIFACIEADKKGADEGLMKDVNGNVSTCNSTNFFIIKEKEVWTSTGEYCLPGVTRGAIIQLCKENNIPIYKKNFSVDDVINADEAFVTGTFAGVIPAVNIDGKMIGDGKRGHVTETLFNLYKNKIETLYPS
jgi:branched-chain amino acid aminotransferase